MESNRINKGAGFLQGLRRVGRFFFSGNFSMGGNWIPNSRLQVLGEILNGENLAPFDQLWSKGDKEI